MRIALRRLAALMLALAAAIAPAQAQNWPSRAITLIVPFPAGGATDMYARTIAPFVERRLGQPVVILNRVGAGGAIGAQAIAQARPDGYTVGSLTFPSAYAPVVQGTARYKAEDLVPLINQANGSIVLVVHPSSPIRSVADFLQFARTAPGGPTIGLTGIGHTGHMGALLLQGLGDYRAEYVPYNGGGPAATALIAGHYQIGMLNTLELVEAHRAGQVRMIALASAERSPLVPNVPTFRESGFDFVFESLTGFAMPQGIPAPVQARLVEAFESAAQDPEYLRIAQQREIIPAYVNHRDYPAYIARAVGQLEQVWRQHPWGAP